MDPVFLAFVVPAAVPMAKEANPEETVRSNSLKGTLLICAYLTVGFGAAFFGFINDKLEPKEYNSSEAWYQGYTHGAVTLPRNHAPVIPIEDDHDEGVLSYMAGPSYVCEGMVCTWTWELSPPSLAIGDNCTLGRAGMTSDCIAYLPGGGRGECY